MDCRSRFEKESGQASRVENCFQPTFGLLTKEDHHKSCKFLNVRSRELDIMFSLTETPEHVAVHPSALTGGAFFEPPAFNRCDQNVQSSV